jgi:predicted GIY-YIG superfamily endonuclease
VILVYQEAAPDRGSAMRREAAIKGYGREQKERLIARTESRPEP